MWGQSIVGLVLGAAIGGIALVGPVSCRDAVAQGFVQGLDDLGRSWQDRGRDHRDASRDWSDRDGCRGGAGLDCDGRRHRRDHRDADHGDRWRHEWRDFDSRHSRGWGPGDGGGSDARGRWHRGPGGFEPPLRDYGGGDFDGAPRGMGLPYWAPD